VITFLGSSKYFSSICCTKYVVFSFVVNVDVVTVAGNDVLQLVMVVLVLIRMPLVVVEVAVIRHRAVVVRTAEFSCFWSCG
jgi:hypothetical protein